ALRCVHAVVLLVCLAGPSPCWSAATRPPRAIPPEGGGGEGARKARAATTSAAQVSTRRRLGNEHDLADVAPLGDHRLRRAGVLEAEVAGDHRLDCAVVEQLAQRSDPRRQRLAVLPQAAHV